MLIRKSVLCALVWGAAFGLAIGLPLGWGLSQFHHSSTFSQDQERSQPRQHADHPIAGYIIKEPDTFLDRLADDPIAIGTFALAFITLLMTFVIGAQVKLARADFNATHRPRIGIRGVHSLTKDDTGFINIVYVNRGIGEAKITEIGCALILGEFIREAPAFEMQKISSHHLKSGDSESHDFWSQRTAIDYVFGAGFHYQSDPRKTPSNAFLVGIIAYEDSMGRRRETGFCRRNAPGTDLWEIVEKSGYEYED